MDTTTGDGTVSVSVAHGLTYANIRHISALIRNDADTAHLELVGAGSGGALRGGIHIDSENVVLVRVTGGDFDTTDYDSTSYNRGWIYIVYEA
jgi:hypothetical protein